jgi:prepilin-type N-terminal cleavage/methylation domain-containing protein
MKQRERLRAFTLLKLRGRCCAFTLLSARDRSSFQSLSSDRRPEFIRRGGTSKKREPRAFTLKQRERSRAFTLLELLVVIAISAVLMVLVAPAFTKIKTGNDITTAAYTMTGALEQGRNYAKANNTYVWVGFYEEDMTATAPTTAPPPYPGKGRVLVASVFSTDGTKIYDDSDPIASLPPTRIKPLGKLVKIEGIHITDIGAPASPGSSPDTLDGRPDWPYTLSGNWLFARHAEASANGTKGMSDMAG